MSLAVNRIGSAWARYINIWGQVGAVVSLIQFAMVAALFYSNTASRYIPLWVYLLVGSLGLGALVAFIATIGIRGYYQFFNQQSAIDRIEKKLDALLARSNYVSDD